MRSPVGRDAPGTNAESLLRDGPPNPHTAEHRAHSASWMLRTHLVFPCPNGSETANPPESGDNQLSRRTPGLEGEAPLEWWTHPSSSRGSSADLVRTENFLHFQSDFIALRTGQGAAGRSRVYSCLEADLRVD
eukprot:scaffold246_cov242-Pinguiococcus_pyrenoidosus.AAC.13